MTIVEAGKKLFNTISAVYDTREAENITGLVMERITGLTKTQRLVNKETLLNIHQQAQLQNFTGELLKHKPVQYVLNEAWFAGMKFYVNEHVLIPRPETEELVERILKDFQLFHHQSPTVIDIGTGSGCIAISLKKKLPKAKVYALEISEQALLVAKQNAVVNHTEIEFLYADIFNLSISHDFSAFDIIVSNPPYIKQSEAADMAANVLLHEPKIALFIPDKTPLVFYEAIADLALKKLKPAGRLYFEINEIMGAEVAALLNEKGLNEVQIKKDMQGKDRFATAIL